MIVIADTNIFYSALITPTGTIAKILDERKKIQYFIPDYLIGEVKEHLPDIQRYLEKFRQVKKSKQQLMAEFALLLEGITIIPISKIKKEYVNKALGIVKDIDEKDYPFIALHFEIKHKIWTVDERLIKGLTEKGYKHIFITTEEMQAKTYKKN